MTLWQDLISIKQLNLLEAKRKQELVEEPKTRLHLGIGLVL
jgi:hypothetical protein